MAELQNSSQLLSYGGNPGLGYGTAGTPATGAEIGVLDTGNGAGFNQLAHATFLKDKEEHDAKKKEMDYTYARLRDIDLSTDKLLDIDKQYIIDKHINPIRNFLIKYPKSVNPSTPEEIQQNLQLKELINNFKDDKAKGQTRYIYKPLIDQSVANNTFDRDEEQKWYDNYLNKPLEYINPYQKTYQVDWKIDAPVQKTKIGKEGNVLHTEKEIDTNIDNIAPITIQKLNSDPNFNKGVTKLYETFLQSEAIRNSHNQELLNKANDPAITPQQKQVYLSQISQNTPLITNEINTVNNYRTAQNKLRSPENQIPLIDTTKTPSKEDFAIIKSTLVNIKQPLQSYDEKTSGRYGIDISLEKAREKSGLEKPTYDLLQLATSIFNPPPNSAAAAYKAGINGQEGYNVYTKNQRVDKEGVPLDESGSFRPDNPQGGLYYNGTNYPNTKVVYDTKTGLNVAKVGDDYVTYNGVTQTWDKSKDSNISLPLSVVKQVPGRITSKSIDGNKLTIRYERTVKGKVNEDELTLDPISTLRALSESPKEFDDTMDRLKSKGININTDEGWKKAMELINGEPTKEQKQNNPKKTYTYGKKIYTTEQVHAKAVESGLTDDEYIKQLGLK